MSQIFFFCTLYDGNTTFIFKCRADLELCCGRGCCSILANGSNSIWSQWYFWFGIALFAILVIGIFLTLTSNSCRPLPIYTENTTQTNNAISRYGIRHILGVQHTRVTNVAATGVTCGPTGLIQPSVSQSKNSNFDNGSSDREITGLTPLRPPYPLHQPSQTSRFSQRLAVADLV